MRSPDFAPVRVVLERCADHTVELQIAADAGRVIFTRKTMNRSNPMDLPGVQQIEAPISSIPAIIAALEAASRAARGGE